MIKLKEKSEFNLEAAKLLIENNLFAPSVHCSYYSVFQLLKYLYIKGKKISFDELSQRIQNDNRNTHRYLIEEFCLYLQTLNNQEFDHYSIRNIKRDINDLKQFRTESDYDDIEIDISKGDKALRKSEDIILKLKKTR